MCTSVFVYLLQPAQGFSVLRESQSWSHRPAGKLVKMWKMQWLPPWAALACQQHHNSGFPAHILDHFWLLILTEFCSHALPYFLTWFSSSLKTWDAKPKTIKENPGPADDSCFESYSFHNFQSHIAKVRFLGLLFLRFGNNWAINFSILSTWVSFIGGRWKNAPWWHFQSISLESNQIRGKCIGLVIFSIQSGKSAKLNSRTSSVLFIVVYFSKIS